MWVASKWRGTLCPSYMNTITRINCERNENFSAKRKKITRLEVEGDASCCQARETRRPAQGNVIESSRIKNAKFLPKESREMLSEALWKPNIENTHLTDLWTVLLKLQKTAVFTHWGWGGEECEETANPFQFTSEISPMHSERANVREKESKMFTKF